MSTMLGTNTREALPSQELQGKGPRLRMVQVFPLSPSKEKTSLMSKLSKLMILLSPATTDRLKSRVNFKWFSIKTLVFSLCYYGLGAGANVVGYLTGFTNQMSSLDLGTKNIIDTGTLFATLAVMVASQTFPFFFASGIPSISGLALAKDLTIPKYGLLLILGSILGVFAAIPGNGST